MDLRRDSGRGEGYFEPVKLELSNLRCTSNSIASFTDKGLICYSGKRENNLETAQPDAAFNAATVQLLLHRWNPQWPAAKDRGCTYAQPNEGEALLLLQMRDCTPVSATFVITLC